MERVHARFPLGRAILFGSRARGDELVDSDYDLVLVSPAFDGMDWSDRIRAMQDLWDLDVGLESLCYTPREFARKAAEISTVAEAVREGRTVWGTPAPAV
ncbi:MAG: nucleotidyltransferase domain-containing protein [Armatimonadetes bacterium]|nr:nucleotidyltransferase domain-containing protein [Armatimonadota bacterium]